MKILFLGTASCYPTSHRAVSCTAVKFEEITKSGVLHNLLISGLLLVYKCAGLSLLTRSPMFSAKTGAIAVNVSSHCARVYLDGDVWLFDCGEGSQVQVQKSTVRPGRISKVFITHLHGDHLFGLPGLICTMGQIADRQDFALDIYGPKGLRRYVRETLNLSRSPLPFSYTVHELIPDKKIRECSWDNWPLNEEASGSLHPQEVIGRTIEAENGIWQLISDGPVTVQAGQVRHRVPTFGFVLTEADRPGKLNPTKLKELGIPPGPLYAQIKRGESITSPSGQIINHSDVMGPPIRGRKLTIVGDSFDSSGLHDIARESDMVIHEATLENSMKDKAIENGHSTPSMAAEFAMNVEAKCLLLYHFSQRYKSLQETEEDDEGNSVKVLLDEVQSALECSSCKGMIAEDLLEVEIPRPNRESNSS